MRSRKRRSVFDMISLVMLEVGILGLFVILAQPQLRDAVFELLSPASHQSARGMDQPVERRAAIASSTSPAQAQWASTFSPQWSAAESARDREVNGQVNRDAAYLDRTIAHVASLPLPAIQPSEHVAAYAPWEHYESFQVAVPSLQSAPSPQSAATGSATVAGSAVGFATSATSGLGTVTQLTPNQWNIGTAWSSTESVTSGQWPPNQAPAGQWAPAVPLHSAQSSYRDIYPPPYGTQSPWR